jgi:hypothetical protein
MVGGENSASVPMSARSSLNGFDMKTKFMKE